MRPLLIVIPLLIAGCSSPIEDLNEDMAVSPEIEVPQTMALNGIVAGVGVYSCLPNGATPSSTTKSVWSQIPILRPDNTSGAIIQLNWTPINPTMETLQIGIADGQDEPDLLFFPPSTSPLEIKIKGSEMDGLGSRFILRVYAGESCATNPGVGAHVSAVDAGQEQRFEGRLAWS